MALYGEFWQRFPATRSLTRGQADAETVRRAILQTKVTLCMVRRANRDGHAMRTFEVPASGGCMLTEDTEEHREIFWRRRTCRCLFPDYCRNGREDGLVDWQSW